MTYFKFLGVIIDSNLTWSHHINHISNTLSRICGVLSRLKHYVPVLILDSLSAEHLLYASPEIHTLLAICFNAFIVHGFLPSSLTDSVIIPIVKDKCKNISDIGNYRPIALSSVLSKVFELILLSKLNSYFCTTDYQFGFKSNHSTDLCIYTLKEVIDFYHSQSMSIYMCFMDASKAFDRVNHWTLFKKLIDRGTPLIFVRIIMQWYTTQKACVRWGSALSDNFLITNGVRQGGILSPLFFNVYMDCLSESLSNTQTGCNVGGVMINHLMYADDMVIISPSAKGLQRLVARLVTSYFYFVTLLEYFFQVIRM